MKLTIALFFVGFICSRSRSPPAEEWMKVDPTISIKVECCCQTLVSCLLSVSLYIRTRISFIVGLKNLVLYA